MLVLMYYKILSFVVSVLGNEVLRPNEKHFRMCLGSPTADLHGSLFGIACSEMKEEVVR